MTITDSWLQAQEAINALRDERDEAVRKLTQAQQDIRELRAKIRRLRS